MSEFTILKMEKFEQKHTCVCLSYFFFTLVDLSFKKYVIVLYDNLSVSTPSLYLRTEC